jgi:orotidine-5'-phosphate decarboxylase
MKQFADRLIEQMKVKKSIICVGLDPRIAKAGGIPNFLLEKNGGDVNSTIWEFNKAIIDATIAVSPIYKPQMAFYEQYDALNALKKTIAYIRLQGALSILDAKRNDIGTTSEAYAAAIFEVFGADAITVNSYFGIDGVQPFLKYIPQGKGLFLLVKTSNPSSGEFQDLFSVALPEASSETVEITIEKQVLVRNYIQMARLLRKWGEDPKAVGTDQVHGSKGYSSLGAVVGATYPAQMVAVRKEIPNSFILIPGYGAQGGTAADILHGVNADGLGAIVNASRSINFAYAQKPYNTQFKEAEFAEAAKIAALDMQQEINTALDQAGKRGAY